MTEILTSNPSIPVRAGNAFVAKFGREPASAADSAWLNGYAESLTEIERLRAIVAKQQRNCSCPHGDCSTCEKAKATLCGEPGSATERKESCVTGWEFDDGSRFELTGAAGGAHPNGMYSEVTCEETMVDGRIRVREYTQTSERWIDSPSKESEEPECNCSPTMDDAGVERHRKSCPRYGW